MIRRIYVAGPYTHENKHVIQMNIERAEYTGMRLAKAGFHVYVPHKATGNWNVLMWVIGNIIWTYI